MKLDEFAEMQKKDHIAIELIRKSHGISNSEPQEENELHLIKQLLSEFSAMKQDINSLKS